MSREVPSSPDVRRITEVEAAGLATLFAEHRDIGYRYAASLAGPVHAEDLLAEAFARIMGQLGSGRGPGDRFRPYLLTVIHNLHVDQLRRATRERVQDEVVSPDEPEVCGPDPEAAVEWMVLRGAFAGLPERWRDVLWRSEVLEQGHSEIAAAVGLTSNAVAALTYRAREALRRAYVAEHLRCGVGPDCTPMEHRISVFVRGGLSARRATAVVLHASTCPPCAEALEEALRVSARMPRLAGRGGAPLHWPSPRLPQEVSLALETRTA
jgi:RNA polymerase sigma factor (sigma-70 family)